MEQSSERDEYLMAQVALGQQDMLELLIRRHATALLTFLTRMLGDRHKAEEQFQEVFFAVWVKRAQYEYPRPFRPWLYAIAVNRCKGIFRLKTPAPIPLSVAQIEDPSDSDASPSEQVIAAETVDLVSQAITRLPPQQRAVVALRIWQGMPYGKIAEIVGCTEGTVRSHMHHGLEALREALKPIVESSTNLQS